MSADLSSAALTAVLEALTLVQGQLDTIVRANARIETVQGELRTRLDTIDAAQAAVGDLVPVLEVILARSIEDRELVRSQLSVVATVAGFAHAAATGNAAALPLNVADEALLERFALTQPADRTSQDRAQVDWRRAAAATNTAELLALLVNQYQPAVSDTPETRVLRYRLAAITRVELEGRGIVPPAGPPTTRSPIGSPQDRNSKSEELAQLWRAGESAALFAEPELAGALDLFADAERRSAGLPEARLSAELAELHRDLGSRVAAGERPGSVVDRPAVGAASCAEVRLATER